VGKDLLRSQDSAPPKDKMHIKTKTAAMGVRGTDFQVTYNGLNEITALVTFEGNVAMARAEPGMDPASALARTDRVQSVGAGQFSGAQPDLARASVPVRISPAQLESLKVNETFQGVGEQAREKANAMASPVPPGVDPRRFSSDADRPQARAPEPGGPPPEGFFDAQTGTYAPRAGGFLDLNSGRYVPPPPGSSFDPNTGVFVPPSAVGQFDPETGMYVPPKGVDLDPVLGFVPEAPRSGPGLASGAGAPTAQATALAAALNQASSPAMAGVTATFAPAFSPTTGTTFAPPPPPPPPPPAPPPPPPQPPEPVSDPTCFTCIQDNIQQTPVNTNVRFSITVQ
jgi:hypothetical protein